MDLQLQEIWFLLFSFFPGQELWLLFNMDKPLQSEVVQVPDLLSEYKRM